MHERGSACIEERGAQGEGEEGCGPVDQARAEEEGGDHAEQRDVEPYGLLVGQRRVLFEARPEGVRSRAAWVFLTCLGSSARLGVRGLGVWRTRNGLGLGLGVCGVRGLG